MSSANALTVPPRNKRVRRDTRRFGDDFDRISAAIASSDTKSHSKNPTRNIPDSEGFYSLSKNDFKKDIKDISKNNFFSSTGDDANDNDESFYSNSIKISIRPPCNPATSLKKKKRRLTNWLQNPSIVSKDLDTWKLNATRSKENFEKTQLEEEIWKETFYITRSSLSDSIIRYNELNNKLKVDSNKLFSLTEQESSSNNTYTIRKKKNWQMKDILTELDDRQLAIDDKIKEYESLVEELSSLKDKNIKAPIIAVTVEELFDPSEEKSEYKNNNIMEKVTGFETDFESWEARLLSSGGTRDVDIVFPYDDEVSSEAKKDNVDVVVTSESINVVERKSIEKLEYNNNDIQNNNNNNMTTSESSSSVNPTNNSTTDLNIKEPEQQKQDLSSVFAAIDESIRVNSLAKNDFDLFFADRFESDTCLIESIVGNSVSDRFDQMLSGSADFFTSIIDKYKLLGKPFLSLESESNWAHYLNHYCDHLQSQGTVTRKKKKSMECVSLSADPRVRIQRGIPLVLSPLSQYEDRILGSVQGNPKHFTDVQLLLPTEIKREEELVLERCRIQSSVASAELKLKHLLMESHDLNKMVVDSESSLLMSSRILQQTMEDDLQERKRIRKELLHYKIIVPNEDDALLSPMNNNNSQSVFTFKNDPKKINNLINIKNNNNKSKSLPNLKQFNKVATNLNEFNSKSLSHEDINEDENKNETDNSNNNTSQEKSVSPTSSEKQENSPNEKKDNKDKDQGSKRINGKSANATQISTNNIIHTSKKRSCR